VLCFAVYVGSVGACLASFGCVAAERVPAGRSLLGRSSCVCGRRLKVTENVPLIGYLRCRGTARCCGAILPRRYLIAEVCSFAVDGGIGVVLGLRGLDGTLTGAVWAVAAAGVLVVFAAGVALDVLTARRAAGPRT
jgi:prepilin signal peptidase PulO-like enzyme (type II secretory pathway)